MDEPQAVETIECEAGCGAVFSGGSIISRMIELQQHMKVEHPYWRLEQKSAAGEPPPEYGPPLYSYWLHHDVFDPSPHNQTLLWVQAWHKHGDDGSIEVVYFCLTGTSNNGDYTNHTIPDEIKSISIRDFWAMVAFGNLKLLMEVPRFYMIEAGVLDLGDVISRNS